MSFTDLTIEDYTNRSVVVQGDTRKYKEDLKKLGGKYNGRLKNGPGWIFPKTSESDLESFIKGGKRLVTAEEAKAGEELSKQRAKEWEQGKNAPDERSTKDQQARPDRVRPDRSEPSYTSISSTTPTLSEYGALLTAMKAITIKVSRIDCALSLLLSDEQKEKLKELMKPKEKTKKKFVVKVVKRKETKPESNSDDSDDSTDEEEEVAPRKRLMRK